jgi:ribonuclease P protein component
MLPSVNRMRNSRDFSTTVRRGRRAGSPTLVVHLQSGNDPVRDHVEVGLVVSRGVGSAVVRNRVKRRLRAVLARRIALMPAGTRLVVRANPRAATSSSAILAGDLDRTFARLGILR